MRTGDTVRDGQSNAYQIGQLLGRGLWGKSFLARRESTDQVFVLKVPLGPEDVRGDVAIPDSLFAASRDALMEEARLYEQGRLPFLPRVEARFNAGDGQTVLLLPRFTDSLERRIQEGLAIGTLIDVLLQVCVHVRALGASGVSGASLHGGLRPSNILFAEAGEIVLTDVAVPAVRRNIGAFCSMLPGGNPWLPPEISDSTAEPAWSSAVDTWSLAMILWRGITGPEIPIAYPARGLDRGAVVALKDRLAACIKAEDSNPRFTGRLAERMGVLLTRALSLEVSPSPPYRFNRLEEFATRLEEIAALIRPHVTNVGKVLHERPAAKPWFDTEETVTFSITVGASAGVDGREEVGVGIAVYDLATGTKIPNLDLGYTADKHPSGRYRFAFRITGMAPGHYRTRVAFAVRDSGQAPATAETEFEVRAAPGWVPPIQAPVGAPALSFTREPLAETAPQGEAEEAAPEQLAPVPTAPDPLEQLRPSAPVSVHPTPVPEAAPPLRPTPMPPAAPPPPRPVQPQQHAIAPAAIASPLPPPLAAMGGTGMDEEPAFKAPQNWTYEPIPRSRAATDVEDTPSSVDVEEEEEPGLLSRAVATLKNDPFVLVMVCLAGLIAVLLLVFLAIRS